MMARETGHMFNLTYEKTAAEIRAQAETKIKELLTKIEERQKRLTALRTEHGIDDAALVQLLTAARRQANSHQYSYTSNVGGGRGGQMEERTIGAGVVNNLLTENDFIEADRASVKRLKMVVRNVRPLDRMTQNGTAWREDAFALSVEEIEFLGF